MAVVIRLRRGGTNKRPCYRVVAADDRMKRDGRFIEQIGYYHPLSVPAVVKIDHEKAMKWLGCGARVTDTVRSLFKREGILRKFHESRFPPKNVEKKA